MIIGYIRSHYYCHYWSDWYCHYWYYADIDVISLILPLLPSLAIDYAISHYVIVITITMPLAGHLIPRLSITDTHITPLADCHYCHYCRPRLIFATLLAIVSPIRFSLAPLADLIVADAAITHTHIITICLPLFSLLLVIDSFSFSPIRFDIRCAFSIDYITPLMMAMILYHWYYAWFSFTAFFHYGHYHYWPWCRILILRWYFISSLSHFLHFASHLIFH